MPSPDPGVPVAAVARIAPRSAALGFAMVMVMVSPDVWFTQLQAVPRSAFAVAAADPDAGVNGTCSPKLGLKSYIAWADTSVVQSTVTACAGAPGAAVALALGVAEGVGVAVSVGVAEGLADGLDDALGVGAQPANRRAARPIVAMNRSRVLAR